MRQPIHLADPTVYFENGTYYLYGTIEGRADGFFVYTSQDLVSWKGPFGAAEGYVLKKEDSFGTMQFWAPQVFFHEGRYYLSYCANEQSAIACASSPFGPFRQKTPHPLLPDYGYKNIDAFVFPDDDGRCYLYYVHQENQNCIYAAELKSDLTAILPGSSRRILEATLPWENTENAPWPVAEGPSVLRHKGLYYMLYCANDFRSRDYAIGYAVSPTPFGPWEKSGSPLISRHTIPAEGPGHGDYFFGKDGQLYYVYHTHNAPSVPSPRRTALIRLHFEITSSGVDAIAAEPESFAYLEADEP